MGEIPLDKRSPEKRRDVYTHPERLRAAAQIRQGSHAENEAPVPKGPGPPHSPAVS